MELDWCVEEDVKNTQLFNDNSVISSKTKKLSGDVIDDIDIEKDLIDITKCFDINIDCLAEKPACNKYCCNYAD